MVDALVAMTVVVKAAWWAVEWVREKVDSMAAEKVACSVG